MTDRESEALQQRYEELVQGFRDYAEQHPNVENTEKLYRRVARDLTALKRFAEDGERVDPIWQEQRQQQLQGFKNNFANYNAKLKVAQNLKGVVALGKVFQYPLAPGIEHKAKPPNEKGPKPVKIEVDIVANCGSAWVQIRTVKIVDTDSLHWIGLPGHHKGLEQKLRDLLAVSHSSEHWIRWRPPDVIVYCSEMFGEDVIEEITSMGAHALNGDVDVLKRIPAPPPPSGVTNLDVTTICALISEVSYDGPQNPEVVRWSRGNKHLQVCVEQEMKEPLLPLVEPFLGDRPLIVAEDAVVQFENLLSTLSGPREKDRWKTLRSRLIVYKTAEKDQWWSERVVSVEELTDLQAAVFGLGDSQRALTVTCNQRLVNKLKQRGIHLEIFVHRPVWLTGL